MKGERHRASSLLNVARFPNRYIYSVVSLIFVDINFRGCTELYICSGMCGTGT